MAVYGSLPFKPIMTSKLSCASLSPADQQKVKEIYSQVVGVMSDLAQNPRFVTSYVFEVNTVPAASAADAMPIPLAQVEAEIFAEAEAPIIPDQPTVCGTAGCIDCPATSAAAEPVAEEQPEPLAEPKPTPVCCINCGKPKPNYNHPNWPSPITKRFAKHLAKHSGKTDPKTIKTHQDALEFIAKRANVSVETLLKWTINHYWTVVQGSSHHFHMSTGSATWWC